MNKPVASYLVAFMVILAGIGLTGNLIQNPPGLLKTFLLFLIVIGVFYLLSQTFSASSKRNAHKRERDAFRKAARQSQRKYKHLVQRKQPFNLGLGKPNNMSSLKKSHRRLRSASHLKVIEGNKGKKKNRASF